jgi:hypothetical protein
MKIYASVLLLPLLLPVAGRSQKLDLPVDHLMARAVNHTAVDLEAAQLRPLLQMALDKKPEKSEKLRKLLEGVESLHVRTFEFAKPGQFTAADLDPVRKQLQAPGWSRIVGVKETNQTVDLYLMMREGKTTGFAVLVAEPKQLVIVNIVGSLQLDQFKELVSSQVQYDLSKLTATASR